MTWLVIFAAIAAGVANPFQSGVNAELNKQLGQPVWTAIFVYGSGLLAVCVVQVCFHQPLPMNKVADVSWWAWLGGLISVVPTVIALTMAQKMGAGIFTGVSVTASLVLSVVMDHFGMIGFRQHAASPARMLGCALMIAGVWVMTKF